MGRQQQRTYKEVIVNTLRTASGKSTGTAPRPFLKWAGGKGQLLGELLPRVDAAGPFRRYFEPFLGGGSLFFELVRTGRLEGAEACLSDINAQLIEAYTVVRDRVEPLIQRLQDHAALHCKDYYYAQRAQVPTDPVARAARFVYLNKTCFNGLHRENRQGGFNVPMGRYANPTVCDEDNLRACSQALQGVRLRACHFLGILQEVQGGDLVYFDPPYLPVSGKSFTGYEKRGFREKDHRVLSLTFKALDRRGARLILSNSAVPVVESLYRGFASATVAARRSINSQGGGRGRVPEIVVTNTGYTGAQ